MLSRVFASSSALCSVSSATVSLAICDESMPFSNCAAATLAAWIAAGSPSSLFRSFFYFSLRTN